MAESSVPSYSEIVNSARKAEDRSAEEAQRWFAENGSLMYRAFVAEHRLRMAAEGRLRGELPPPVEKCGARAVGGPCVLPAGHNVGHPDVPQAHRTGPAHRNNRAHEIGRELVEVDSAVEHLLVAYGNLTDSKYNAYDSDVWTELNNRRDALRRELFEMG